MSDSRYRVEVSEYISDAVGYMWFVRDPKPCGSGCAPDESTARDIAVQVAARLENKLGVAGALAAIVAERDALRAEADRANQHANRLAGHVQDWRIKAEQAEARESALRAELGRVRQAALVASAGRRMASEDWRDADDEVKRLRAELERVKAATREYLCAIGHDYCEDTDGPDARCDDDECSFCQLSALLTPEVK